MHKLSTFLLIALTVAGCATEPGPAAYGNFVTGAVTADEKAMADDAARKLAALYPPARTRFNLRQATPDTFGALLVASLRAKGYAMAELNAGESSRSSHGVSTAVPGDPAERSLAYVVDQPLDAGLYRVTLLVDAQSLSRLYQAGKGRIAPACDWIRKE